MIRTGEDYRDIVYEYLVRCAAEGAIYVELTASADHAAGVGLSDEEHLAGLAQGIDDAREQTGIEARIVMSCVRHRGPERAREVARRTVEAPHPYVTGFGMGGDEAGFPPADFADAFAIAREAGLGLTVHAGEWAGPESVRSAASRSASAGSATASARSRTPSSCASSPTAASVLEVCPTSNVVLGLYPSYRGAPAARPARGRRPGHARLRRPALLGRLDRRRVRGRGRARSASTTRRCARSRGPRCVRPSSRRTSGGASSIWSRLPTDPAP